MTEQTSRRPQAATIALAGAALIALVAIGVAALRPGEEAAQADPHANLAAFEGAAGAEAIREMEERLRQDPDNHQGWFMLGFHHRNAGRFAEAEQAFHRAAELAPRNADYAAYRGEALLLIGRENPPSEAERQFRRAIELDPANPQARYYLATIKDISGDHRGALDDLIALLNDAPADAPWEPQVREAVAAIASERNIDVSGRIRPPSASATAAIPGPTREQMEAARAIPPGEQDEMVRGMVDRLAGRLRENPRDAEGWIRLMRSRMVLGEADGASAALRSGLAAFEGDRATQERLRAAARQLGVPG